MGDDEGKVLQREAPPIGFTSANCHGSWSQGNKTRGIGVIVRDVNAVMLRVNIWFSTYIQLSW